jgi:hypothetical protein
MPAPRNGDEDIIGFPEQDPFLLQICHFRVLIIFGRSSKSLAIVPVAFGQVPQQDGHHPKLPALPFRN